MSKPVISVEGIGKAYRIGLGEERFPTLRDAIVAGVSAPLRRFRRLGKLRSGEDVFWALRGVSFEIQPGQVVGIIGRNGAGKSTLLKILSRITEPTEGTARLRGRVASLLEVGTGFHPELTGRENIYLNGAILGMKKAEILRKFDEIVAFSEVEKFLDTPVKRYSSGMYVRLAFAVAAHVEPDVLIVDEVLAVGDAQFQRKCLGKMQDIARGNGRAVLFVSHNMAAVQSLCPTCMLLSASSIVATGTTKDVVARYLSSLEEGAGKSLELRNDRSGAGKVRLVEVASSLSGAPYVPLRCGADAWFVFRVSRAMTSLQLIFALYDMHGNLVVVFDSRNVSPHDHVGDAKADTIRCEIEEVTLVPGRYRMNVAIFAGHELQDHVEGAIFVNVQEGVLRGRPVPADSRGTSQIPHRWVFS